MVFDVVCCEFEVLCVDLIDDILSEVGVFIDVYMMILSDEMFVQEIIDLICMCCYNVEWVLIE